MIICRLGVAIQCNAFCLAGSAIGRPFVRYGVPSPLFPWPPFAQAHSMLRLETGIQICGFDEKKRNGGFTADDVLMLFAILGYTVIQ